MRDLDAPSKHSELALPVHLLRTHGAAALLIANHDRRQLDFTNYYVSSQPSENSTSSSRIVLLAEPYIQRSDPASVPSMAEVTGPYLLNRNVPFINLACASRTPGPDLEYPITLPGLFATDMSCWLIFDLRSLPCVGRLRVTAPSLGLGLHPQSNLGMWASDRRAHLA
jgi:hypothetical protein